MLKVANSVISASRITGVLPVVNGGTGVTTSTGTGNTVLSASPTLSGDVTLSTGNLIPSTAAKGVNFTANTPAAGMTSQLLNWYEEGTWTPVASPSTGSLTAYTSSGFYTRIGKTVNLQGVVTVTTLGTAGGGFNIAGLPFSVNSSISQMVGLARDAGVSGKLGQVYVYSNNTSLQLQDVAGLEGIAVWFANASWRFNLAYFI